MTLYTPATTQTLALKADGSKQKFWALDKFLMDQAAAGQIDLAVSATAPADTTKIWLQPDTTTPGPGTATYHDGAAWVALTPEGMYLHIKNKAGDTSAIEHNFNATAAPTVTDDASADYTKGSLWIDTTNNEAYRLLDSTVGAAVWVKTTLGTDELGDMALQNKASVDIDGGNIDGTVIGAATAAAATFTTLKANDQFDLPSWATAGRPAAPTSGTTIGYNSTIGNIEWWDGTNWKPVGETTLLGLTDTPAAYIADAEVRVNSAGTAIEFVAIDQGSAI